jgi:hypothetical protein
MLQTGVARGQASPPPATSPDWLVVVATPVYQPDGGVTTETTPLPMAGAGLVHMFARGSVCAPASTGAAEPKDAGFGWRIASQIISRSERDVVVSLDWRRLWDGGRKVSGPGGSVQLTLHPGDRIPLDLITNAPRGECRAVGLGLEVRLGRAAVATSTPASMIPIGATPGGAKALDADLWLIHTLPSGVEQVVHQVVRVPIAGGTFGFAPTSVETTRGSVNVQLTGSIDRFRSPTGGEFLVMAMTRLVTGDGLPPTGASSNTSSVIGLPTEAVLFELNGAGSGARSGGGGAGGRGGARSGGGAGSGVAAGGGSVAGGIVAARTPLQQTPAAGAGQVVARGSGGGSTVPVAVLLEGHKFALNLRVTEVTK